MAYDKNDFSWIDTSSYNPTALTSSVANNITRNNFLSADSTTGRLNDLTDEQKEYFIIKEYDKNYRLGQNDYDYILSKYSDLYRGKDPESYEDRLEVARELNTLFPQYSEDYFFNNAEDFMYLSTGVKQDIKGYGDNLAQIWKSAWADALGSASVMGLYLTNPSEWGTENFQQKKQKLFNELRTNGSAYRKDLADIKYNNIFQQMGSATMSQAPNILFNLALSLGTMGAGAVTSTSMKAVGATAKAMATADKALKGVRLVGNLGWTFITEGGSIVSEMAQMGFDDDLVMTFGVGAGLLTSVFEVWGDETVFRPINKFTDYLFDTGASEAVVTGTRALGTFFKEGLNSQITEPTEEYLESHGENWAIGIADAVERERGKTIEDLIGYTKYEVADSFGKKLVNFWQFIKKGHTEGVESAYQASLSTPFMSLGGSVVSNVGSTFFGPINHTYKGAKNFNVEGARDVVSKKNIVMASVENVDTKGIKLEGKVAPVSATRVGDTVFINNPTAQQALAVKNSEYVLTGDLDDISFEKKYSGEKETARKNGALNLINSDSTTDTGLTVAPAHAERLLVEEYNTGKLSSYSYLLDNGTLSQTNDGTANALIVEREGLEAHPFKINIDQSIDGKNIDTGKAKNSLMNTAEAMASVFSDGDAIQSFISRFTDDQLETYGQRQSEKKSSSKAKARENVSKKKQAKASAETKTTTAETKTADSSDDMYNEVLGNAGEKVEEEFNSVEDAENIGEEEAEETEPSAEQKPAQTETPAEETSTGTATAETASAETATAEPATESTETSTSGEQKPAEGAEPADTSEPDAERRAVPQDNIARKIQSNKDIKTEFKDFERKRTTVFDKSGIGNWSYRNSDGNKTTKENAEYLSVATPKGTETTYRITSWTSSDLDAVDKWLNGDKTAIEKNAQDRKSTSKKKALKNAGVKETKKNSTETYGESSEKAGSAEASTEISPAPATETAPAGNATMETNTTESSTATPNTESTSEAKPAETTIDSTAESTIETKTGETSTEPAGEAETKPTETEAKPAEAEKPSTVTDKDVDNAQKKITEEKKDIKVTDAETVAVASKIVSDLAGIDYDTAVSNAVKVTPIVIDENSDAQSISESLADFVISTCGNAKKMLTDFYGIETADNAENRDRFVADVADSIALNNMPDNVNAEIVAKLREGCNTLLALRDGEVNDKVPASMGVGADSPVEHQINAEDSAKDIKTTKDNADSVPGIKTTDDDPASSLAMFKTTFTDAQMKRMDDGGYIGTIIQNGYTSSIKSIINSIKNSKDDITRKWLSDKLRNMLVYAMQKLGTEDGYKAFNNQSTFQYATFPNGLKDIISTLCRASVYANIVNDLKDNATKEDIINAFQKVIDDKAVVAKYKGGELSWDKVLGASASNRVRFQVAPSNTFNSQKEAVRKKYSGTDKWMKAPNGNATNLTEDQWLTVRTDNFKRWFGDWENDSSLIDKLNHTGYYKYNALTDEHEEYSLLDENGEPKVFYNGNSTTPQTWDFSRTPLMFFTEDAGYADKYANKDANWVRPTEYSSALYEEYLNRKRSDAYFLRPQDIETLSDVAYRLKSFRETLFNSSVYKAQNQSVAVKRIVNVLNSLLETFTGNEETLYSDKSLQNDVEKLESSYDLEKLINTYANSNYEWEATTKDTYSKWSKAYPILESLGIDAIIYNEEAGASQPTIAVLNNASVKSATDNNGNFSSSDSRFRYQFTPSSISFKAQYDDIRKQYYGTEKWMKAPNGKDTNLSEEQWITVRTDNFKAWFGDWENDSQNASKIVDENGEPLVVYHGTLSEFDRFEKGDIGYHFGTKAASEIRLETVARNTLAKEDNEMNGYYKPSDAIGQDVPFAYPEDYEQDYINEYVEDSGIYLASFLNIRNPYYAKFDFSDWSVANPLTRERFQKIGVDFSVIDSMAEDDGGYKNLNRLQTQMLNHTLADQFEDNTGCDGIIYVNQYEDRGSISYIALDSNQIKSATENSGDFSSNDSRFRFQILGKAGAERLAYWYPELHAGYKKAQTLEKSGLSNYEIWEQTGWYRGLDGEWRSEIADGKLNGSLEGYGTFGVSSESNNGSILDTDEIEYTMPTVLENPILYDAYPFLKWSSVIIGANVRNEDGHYSLSDKNIYLNAVTCTDLFSDGIFAGFSRDEKTDALNGVFKNTDEYGFPIETSAELRTAIETAQERFLNEDFSITEEGYSSLLHEIAHAIQDKERFANGGSPQEHESLEDLQKTYKKRINDSREYIVNNTDAMEKLKNFIASDNANDIMAIEELEKIYDIDDSSNVIVTLKSQPSSLSLLDKAKNVAWLWERSLASFDQLSKKADMADKAIAEATAMSALTFYTHILGEIEARMVETRAKLEDKSSVFPLDSADVTFGSAFNIDNDEIYSTNANEFIPRTRKELLDNGMAREALADVSGAELVNVGEDGLLTFDRGALARHIYNLSITYGEESKMLDSINFASQYLTSLSPSVQDSIIRYNMILNGSVNVEDIESTQFYDTTRALDDIDKRVFSENKDEVKGALIVDSAKTILNSSADISTIIHENCHMVLRANTEVRSEVLNALREVASDAKKSEALKDAIRKNLPLFERFRGSVTDSNGTHFMTDDELVDKEFNLLSMADESSLFENVDVEEAITQLFEAWVYTNASQDSIKDYFHESLSGIHKVFARIWETLLNIYKYVVGDCEFPSEIDDAFFKFFDEDLSRTDIIEIKQSMSPIVYSSLRHDLSLSEKNGLTLTRTYQKWTDYIINSIPDEKLSAINKEFMGTVGDRFITDDDIDVMKTILEKNGVMQNIMQTSAVPEEQENLKDMVASYLAYSNESIPAEAQKLASLADSLRQKTPTGRVAKDRSGNVKFVSKDSEAFKAVERFFYGDEFDERKSNKDSKSQFLKKPTNGLVSMVRYLNLTANSNKWSDFLNVLGLADDAPSVNLYSKSLDYANTVGKDIDSLAPLGLLFTADGKGFSDDLSVEDLYNLITTLIVNEDGNPVCWTRDSKNIPYQKKAGRFKDAGEYFDGILPYLEYYAHLDRDAEYGDSFGISRYSVLNANSDYVRASSALMYEKYKEDIFNKIKNPAGLIKKEYTPSQYMFNSNVVSLLEFIRDNVEGGLPVIGPDTASYDYLDKLQKDYESKLEEAIEAGKDLNTVADAFEETKKAVLSNLTAIQKLQDIVAENLPKARANTKEGNEAKKTIINALNSITLLQQNVIDKKNTQVDNLVIKLADKEDEATEDEKKILELTDELAVVKDKVAEYQKYKNGFDKLNGILSNHEDGSPLTDEEEKVFAKVNDEIADLRKSVSSLVGRLNRADAKIAKLTEENKELREKLQSSATVNAVMDEKERVAEAISALQSIGNDETHKNSYATRQVNAFLKAFEKQSVPTREEVKQYKKSSKTIVHPSVDVVIDMKRAFSEFYDNLIYMTDPMTGKRMATGLTMDSAKSLLEFAVNHKMFEQMLNADGTRETDENGNPTFRAKVTKSYKSLTVDELAELSDILLDMQKDEETLRAKYLEEYNRKKMATDEAIVNDAVRFGQEKKKGREESFRDWQMSNENIAGKEYESNRNNVGLSAFGELKLIAPQLRGRLNALYSFIYGGTINGNKVEGDLNTRYNGQGKFVRERLDKAFKKMADVLNSPEGIKKTVGLKSLLGIESGEWTKDDILRYGDRIFNMVNYSITPVSAEDFVSIAKENGDNIKYEVKLDGRKKIVVEPLDIRPEVKAIAKDFNNAIIDLEDKQKKLDSKKKRVQALQAKEANGSITEVESKQLERALKAQDKLEREVFALSHFGERLDTKNNPVESKQTYSAQMLMGIYLLAQQEGGIYKLVNDYKIVGEGEDMHFEVKGGVNTSSLSYGEVLGVMADMMYDEDYAWIREIAEIMQEAVGERREVLGDVYWRVNNEAMDTNDRYFTEVSEDDTANFGRDISLNVYEKYVKVSDRPVTSRTVNASYVPNLYSFNNFVNAINQQEHYIWFAEWQKQFESLMNNKIINDGEGGTSSVRSELFDAILYAFGEKKGSVLINSLKSLNEAVAGYGKPHEEADAVLDTIHRLRSNKALGALALSIPATLEQFTTLLYACEDTGIRNTLSALAWYTTGNINAVENLFDAEGESTDEESLENEISEKQSLNARSNLPIGESDMEDLKDRDRVKNFIYKYSSQMENVSEEHASAIKDNSTMIKFLNGDKSHGKVSEAIGETRESFMNWCMHYIDGANRYVANITWLAYYKYNYEHNQRNGLSELEFRELCANEATQKTMDITPSNNPKDESAVFRSKDAKLKELFLFKKQTNKMENKLIDSWSGWRDGSKSGAEFMKMIVYTGIITASSSLISGHILPKKKGEEDDSSWLKTVAMFLLEGLADNTTLFGDALQEAVDGLMYYDSNVFGDAVSLVRNASNYIEKTTKKNLTKMGNSISAVIADIAGIYGGFPTTTGRKVYRIFREDNLWYGYNSAVGDYFKENAK